MASDDSFTFTFDRLLMKSLRVGYMHTQKGYYTSGKVKELNTDGVGDVRW